MKGFDRSFFEKMAVAKEGFEVVICWGPKGCPNAITSSQELAEKIKKFLEEEKITEFLMEKTKGRLKKHNKFKVGIAECPNACSQIYIMDIAIHGFLEPYIEESSCDLCGSCKEACEEDAITLEETSAKVNLEKCVGCGSCEKVCEKGAIKRKFTGYKMYLGGKLGRHPRLATFYKILSSPEEVFEEVKKIVKFYKEKNQKGERLGAILERENLDI
ncbi:MAG: 4Fe-4S dicluster domain-containing protein [Thermodesulfobacteria bacterium]|nr:4Fe-4S dicluster domain-containing protein [Thermodesulfobacteriota bacterium]